MDFLSFKIFISIRALIAFYYLGAIVFPVLLWLVGKRLIHQYDLIKLAHDTGKELIWSALSKKQKIKLILLFGFFTFMLELFWRMLFEFLIAYLQIRDALMQSMPLIDH